jgi:hypothetical protein
VSDGYEVTAFANGEALLEAFLTRPADPDQTHEYKNGNKTLYTKRKK